MSRARYWLLTQWHALIAKLWARALFRAWPWPWLQPAKRRTP